MANKPALVSSSAQIGEYGIFATTGSNQFDGSQAITGSLTVTGEVVAQTLNVQQVTSSIVYSSGSNVFGNDLGNTQQFTGSMSVTGSLAVAGALSGTSGTLTGALNGTSATFSSSITAQSTGGSGLRVYGSSGTNQWDIYLNSTNLRFSDNTGTGNIVFDRPLNGTSALFNSDFLQNETSKVGISFASGYGQINSWGANTSTFGGLKFQLSVSNGNTFNALILEPSGTATFSSSVGVGGSSPEQTLDVYSAGSDPTTVLQIRADRSVYGNVRAQLKTYAGGSTATDRFTIGFESATDALTILGSGNVGIGVTPSTWNTNSRALQLTSFISLSQQNNGALNLMSYAIESTGNSFTYGDTGVYPTRLNMNPNDGVITFFNAGTGTVGGAVTFTPRLTILNNGNVGIGTNNPVNKLHVAGGGILIDNNQDYRIKNSSGTQRTLIYMNSSNKVFLVNDDGDIILSPTGNVGIGTTSPSYKLHATVSSANVAYFNRGTTDGDILTLAVGGTNAFIFNTTSSTRTLETPGAVDFRHWVNGSERMRITSGGAVGIGNTSPSEYGSGYANLWVGSSGKIGYLSVFNGSVNLELNADGNGVVRTRSNHALIFGTNETERMRITSDGNVGIGTTTINSERLTVAQTTGNASALYVYTSGVTTGQSYGLTIQAGTNASDGTLRVFSQSGTQYFLVRGDGLIQTGTASASPYNNTSGAAANMVVNSQGTLERSTSSLKYKTDIQDYDKGLAEVLKMRPVYYKSINEREKDLTFAGLIAEEIEELGLTEFVQYAPDGSPDALAYQNMIALAFKAIQEQQTQIESLKAEIQTLKQ